MDALVRGVTLLECSLLDRNGSADGSVPCGV